MSSDLRTWMRNNMTFYNTGESDGPMLGSVSKRVWYHVTDDTESYPFDSVIDAAIAVARADSAVPSSHVSGTDEPLKSKDHVSEQPSVDRCVLTDAERYRWLREYDVDSYLASGKFECLDAAIDEAMRAARQRSV